jgi:UDP-N-acetylglucosamine 3-dehydrogenase
MRIGVIGAGVMGLNHIRVVHQSTNELAGIADAHLDGAKKAAATHQTHAYPDLESLLSATDPEAVIIATPTATHGALALRALEAGLHVLVEKPIAPDLDTARRMVEAAADAKKVLAVGHIERHNPVVEFARSNLASGRFGRPISLSTRRVSNLPGRIRDVGCLLDIGIHDIDVLNHLAAASPRRVISVGGSHATKEGFEDHANLLLEYPNGLVGSVEVNWLTPRKVRRLSLTCDAAFVECDYMAQTAEISRTTFGEVDPSDLYDVPISTHVERIELIREEPLKRELEDFVRACLGGGRPLADGQVGLEALSVAQAALRSMTTGRPETPQGLKLEA